MELSDVEVDGFNEAIKKVNTRFGDLDNLLATMNAYTKTGINDKKEERELFRRIIRERKTEEKEIIESRRKGTITAKQADIALKKLNQDISEVIPDNLQGEFKKVIEVSRILTQREAAFADALKLTTPTIKFMGATIGIAGNSLKGFVDSFTKSGSDIGAATSFTSLAFTTAADATNATSDALKETGSAVSSLGNSTSRTGKAMKFLGGALEIGSGIVGFFGKGLSEVAKSAIPILNAELEKVFNSFLQINASGAVFANGLTGMVDAATKSYLTLDEFSDVIKSNSETLSRTGMGVAAAATQIGNVSTALRRGGLDKQLYNLGFTYKDQAELVAETMALMRQSGGRLTASDAVVAEQTQKYAENLRIIASITGEDAKSKVKAAQDAANELAFQQKLAGMDETTRAGTIEAMASMSDIQRKAFMEQVVFGTQITRETAYAVNNIAGLGDSVNAYVQAFNDRTISAQKSLDIQNQFGGTIKNALLQEQDLARAGMANIDVAKSLTDAFGKELQFRNKFSEDAGKAAQENIDKIKNGSSEMQTSMLAAAEAARGLKMAIQTELLGTGKNDGIITKYADVVKQANTTMLDAMKSLREQLGGKTVTQAAENKVDWKGAAEGAVTGAAIGGMVPIADLTGIPQLIGGLVGGMIGSGLLASRPMTDEELEATRNSMNFSGGNFADGGISSGPTTGYFAKLHGTEAVLPPDLTDMLMNSASVSSPAQIVEAYNNLRSTTNDHLNATQDTNDLMSSLILKMDQLIDATKDVAGNTQRTAARVA